MPETNTITAIRCSALPRILECPGSLTPPIISLLTDNADAAVGRAAHEALSLMVKKAEVDLKKIAKKHEIPIDQIAPLYFIGRRIWSEYEDALVIIAAERHMMREIIPGVELGGTPDIIARAVQEARPTIVPWDWKSGVMVRCRDQLIGYAWLFKKDWPSEYAKAAVCWLREQMVDIEDIGIDEVDALPDRIREAIAHQERFSPNYDSCKYCPRQHECPAHTALVRKSIDTLSEIRERFEALPPAELASLYPKAKLIEGFLKHYHATLRNTVAIASELSTGDGRKLTIQPTERQNLITETALPLLTKKLGSLEDVYPAIKLSRKEAIGLVRDAAPRGPKKEAQEALMAELDEAGAIERKIIEKLTVTKEDASDGKRKRESGIEAKRVA